MSGFSIESRAIPSDLYIITVPGSLPGDWWEINIRCWGFEGPPLNDLGAFVRFWSRVEVHGECWLWIGAKSKGGPTYGHDNSKKSEYGNFKFKGKTWKVHRLAYK